MSKTFSQKITVQEDQTAMVYGSGLLPVYATPALIGFMENTAMQLIDLQEGESSVGISINMQHLKASAIGETIECTAIVTAQDGRKYSFEIQATDSAKNIVGTATHERFVVNVERFMSKL